MSDEPKQRAKAPKQKKETKEDKIAELTTDLKRIQAEFENYKKRAEKENAQFCEYAKAEIVKKLLSVLDSFEIALKSTGNHEEFVKGIELIYSQLYTLLKGTSRQKARSLILIFTKSCCQRNQTRMTTL
jgi:molecular chaperone GrpE